VMFLAVQTAERKPPDLNGFWNNQYTPNLAQPLGHEPPYTAYGLERWKNVDTKDDPTATCLPVGPSRAFTAPLPFQAVQSSEMIAFLFEYQTIYRMVYLDGRPHPSEIMDYPEFMGHSIGHWEMRHAGRRYHWDQRAQLARHCRPRAQRSAALDRAHPEARREPLEVHRHLRRPGVLYGTVVDNPDVHAGKSHGPHH